MDPTIENWRKKIDAIDAQLLDLLNQRAEMVRRVAIIKQQRNAPVCDPTREHELLEKLCRFNAGPLESEAIVEIFSVIIRESRSLQDSLFQEKDSERLGLLHKKGLRL